MAKFEGDGLRHCPRCSYLVPTKRIKGKLYFLRHSAGRDNCAGSNAKVKAPALRGVSSPSKLYWYDEFQSFLIR